MTASHIFLLILLLLGIVVVEGQNLPFNYTSSKFFKTDAIGPLAFAITNSTIYYSWIIVAMAYDRTTNSTISEYPTIGFGTHFCGIIDANSKGAYYHMSYHPSHGVMVSDGFSTIGLRKETEVSCLVSQYSTPISAAYSNPRYHKGNIYFFNSCTLWRLNGTTYSMLLGNSSACSNLAPFENVNPMMENMQSPYAFTIDDNDVIYIFTAAYFIVYSKGTIVRKVKSPLPDSPGSVFKLHDNILIVLTSLSGQVIRFYIDSATFEIIYQPTTVTYTGHNGLQLIDSTIYVQDGAYIMALDPYCPQGYFLNKTLNYCTPMCFGKIMNDTNVCSGRGSFIGKDKCSCNYGYGGSTCELVKCYGVYSNDSNVCSGLGYCAQPDQCVCIQDVSGSNCDYYECYSVAVNSSNVCSGKRGVCSSPNSCQCYAGYLGNNCEYFSCFGTSSNSSSVCSGKGICSGVNICNCTSPGYFGDKCEMVLCNGKSSNSTLDVCSGNGQCVGYNHCNCKNGYSGLDCQFTTCFGINSSLSNVCNGRGSCSKLDTCICNKTDWFGSECSVTSCSGIFSNSSSVCSSHGNCIGFNNCSCSFGYMGINCETFNCNQGNVKGEEFCLNNGTCGAGKCNCRKGYTGDRCEYTVCFDRLNSDPMVCSTHGSCSSPDNCTCSSGWSGPNCNVTQCFGKTNFNASVCSGHGSCISYDNCSCSQGYVGLECQFESCNGKLKSDPTVCSSRGDCFASTGCICKNGFIGNDCQFYELVMNNDLTLNTRIHVDGLKFSLDECASFNESEIFGIESKCSNNEVLTIQLGYLHRVGNGTILYESENSFLVIPNITLSNTIQIKKINNPHPKDQPLTIQIEKNNAFSLFGKQSNKFFIGNQVIESSNNFITLNTSKLATYGTTLSVTVQSTNVFGIVASSSTTILFSSSGPSYELLNDLSGNTLTCNGYDCIVEFSVKNYGTKITSRFDGSFSFFGASSEQLLRVSNIMSDNSKAANQYNGNLDIIGSLKSQFTSSNNIQLDYSVLSSIDAQLVGVNKNHIISNDLNIQIYFNNPLINLLSNPQPSYSWTCMWFNEVNTENIDCSSITSAQLTIKSSNLKLGTYSFTVNILIDSLTKKLNGQVNVNSTTMEIDIDTIAYNYPHGRDIDLTATIQSSSVTINNCSWLVNYDQQIGSSNLKLSKSKLSGKSTLSIDSKDLLASSKYLLEITCNDINGLISKSSKEILIGEVIRGACRIFDETNQWIAYESIVTIDCSSLSQLNKVVMTLYDSSGKLLHVYSNTLKKTITTRLPLINNGYFEIDLIDRIGSIKKVILNNITTSSPTLSDWNSRLSYVSSKFSSIQTTSPINGETINVIYSLFSLLLNKDDSDKIKSSLIQNVLNHLKGTLSIGYNMNDRISTLLVSPIYNLCKLTDQLSMEDLSFWINYMLNAWVNVEKYYSKENKHYIYNNEHLNMLLDLSYRAMRMNQVSNIAFAGYNMQIIQILKNRKYYSFDSSIINLVSFNRIDEMNTKQIQLPNATISFPSDFSSRISVHDYESVDLITQNYNDNTTINTLSISLFNSEGGELSVKNLENPILITFNLKISYKVSNVSCMYLNTTTGKWSTDGIISTFTVLENNTDYMTLNLKCQTFHLTTFGVLDQSTASESIRSVVDSTNYAAIIAPSVIIPLFVLLVVCVIAIVIGILLYRRKKSRERLNTTESSTVLDIPLTETKLNPIGFYEGSMEDFPSDDSVRFKPLMSVRESMNGSTDLSSGSSDPIEKYQVLERVGQGAFGSIYKVKELKSGKIRAVKALKYSNNDDLNLMMKEGMQLMNISHPNILRVNDLFVGNSQLLYIDMDFYENGDLNNIINKKDLNVSERIILQILEQSCSALNFVHTELRIIHRDVKPGNIFIQSLDEENIHVILADFGLAKQNQGSINNSYAGTPLFMSPELGLGAKYSYNTDIYSLGVTIYQIMTKDTSSSISHLCLSLDSAEVKEYLRGKMKEPAIYSERLIEIILTMLEKDPNKRPSAKQLIQTISNN